MFKCRLIQINKKLILNISKYSYLGSYLARVGSLEHYPVSGQTHSAVETTNDGSSPGLPTSDDGMLSPENFLVVHAVKFKNFQWYI